MSIFTKSAEDGGNTTEQYRKEQTSSRPWSGSEPTGEVSIVGRGVRIEGDIHVKGDVRVGGRINGGVYVEERIVVASEGIILGGIDSGDGDIAGKVEGDITCRGKLSVRKTASILGKITADALIVEEGAKISGTCSVGKPNRIGKESDTVGDGADGAPSLLPLEQTEDRKQ